MVFQLQQFSQLLRFQFSEMRFAVLLKNPADGHAGVLGDPLVLIDERPAKPVGESATQRGFSAAAITDQKDTHAGHSTGQGR